MPLRHALTPLFATALLTAAAATVPAVAAAATSGGTSASSGSGSAPTTTAAAKKQPSGTRAVNQRPSSWGYVRLQSGSRLKVRKTPERTGSVGSVRKDTRIRVSCQMNSVPITGKYGASRIWDRIKLPNGRTGYVPDASVENEKNALVAGFCGFPDPGPPAATNPGQGRCSSVATVPLVPPPADHPAFIAAAAPIAQQSAAATRVPASVTIAQGIQESGWGSSTAGANNYFGIKAQAVTGSPGIFRWSTLAVGCVHKPTYESESGGLVRQIGQFRMYPGMQESFDDHGQFLVQNSRYAPAFAFTNDPDRFAQAIHKAGYATDPSYSSALIKLMNTQNLKQYDR